jgi:predicted SPOUT superfamily RNA methylase MTH1
LPIRVCLPSSTFEDLSNLRDKTIRAGQIGRACSIFGVDRIFVYSDPSGDFEEDEKLLKLLLEYLNTPQYLRRKLYPKRKELEFVGMLPPLRTPLHTVQNTIDGVKPGEIRAGLVEQRGSRFIADVGLETQLPVENKPVPGKVSILRVVQKKDGRLACVPTLKTMKDSSALGEYYFGYAVRSVGPLLNHLKSIQPVVPILTTRSGRCITDYWAEFCRQSMQQTVELVFGGPERGLSLFATDIRGLEGTGKTKAWNFFPSQKTETVRLEEALLGCLSITNIARRMSL